VWELPGLGFDPLVHVFNPYFVMYVDLGGSGPLSSFSLIPTISVQSNLAKGRISDLSHIADVNGFVRSWPYLTRYLNFLGPSSHPPKRHHDQFTRFRTAHSLVCTNRQLVTHLGCEWNAFVRCWPSSNTFACTASRSVQPFLRGSRTSPTDSQSYTQTDRPRYSVCSNRPHLMHWVHAMQPNNTSKTFGARASLDHLEEITEMSPQCYWRVGATSPQIMSMPLPNWNHGPITA